MTDKKIEPINPASATETTNVDKSADRKTANFKWGRKLASVKFHRKSGRKTNSFRIG